MNEVYTPQFQHQYAWLVVSLESVNKELEPALLYLQSRRQQQVQIFDVINGR